MRIGIVIALAAVLAMPCCAAKRVTVEELEETLASSKAVHQVEATVVRQLSAMELTERLSSARLERLKAGLPGVKSQMALQALADSSAFLDPPAVEIASAPAPDSDALYKMLVPVANYVHTTLHQLPNFIAQREITGFEGQPPHFNGRLTSTITYRDHKELVEKADAQSRINQPETPGLVTHGVFGPILTTVLKDALTSSIRWGRWEAGSNGSVAVLLYTVPMEKSHYSAWSTGRGNSCAAGYAGGLDALRTIGDPTCTGTEAGRPAAYHGEIAFDPTSGAILRLAIVADMSPNDSIIRDDIAVEYGSVEIGGKSYICPVRSISLMIERTADYRGLPQRLLNDVVYREYHRFGSESRMMWDPIEPTANP